MCTCADCVWPLGAAGHAPETVRGVGYRMTATPESVERSTEE